MSHTAASASRRAGVWAAAGIATAGAIWAAAAAIGLGLVLDRADWADDALRIIGGLYLAYLGATLIAQRDARPGFVAAPERRTDLGWWRRGVLTNLTNPKAAVFFLSIFAGLIPVDATTSTRLAAVAVIGVNSLFWHALLATALSTPRAQAGYARRGRVIDLVAGTVMISFGIALALDV